MIPYIYIGVLSVFVFKILLRRDRSFIVTLFYLVSLIGTAGSAISVL